MSSTRSCGYSQPHRSLSSPPPRAPSQPWVYLAAPSSRHPALRSKSTNDSAADDDVPGIAQHVQIEARIVVVDDEVGRCSFDQPGQPEPAACFPRSRGEDVAARHAGAM